MVDGLVKPELDISAVTVLTLITLDPGDLFIKKKLLAVNLVRYVIHNSLYHINWVYCCDL